MPGTTAFQGGQTLPAHLVPISLSSPFITSLSSLLSFVLPFPSQPSSRRYVQLECFASAVSFPGGSGAEPGHQSIRGTFEPRKCVQYNNHFGFLVGTKMSIWSFWTTSGVSSNYIMRGGLLVQWRLASLVCMAKYCDMTWVCLRHLSPPP